jgi:hypothetical protein
MIVQTQSGPFKKALAANATGGFGVVACLPGNGNPGFPDGTFPVSNGDGGGPGANALAVMPYATGADDATFDVRVVGWRLVGTDPATAVWVWRVLAEVACVAGAAVGLAGRSPSATERFADTLTKTTGSDTDLSINSPANDTPGGFTVDLMGAERYTLDFNLGSATGANALVAPL